MFYLALVSLSANMIRKLLTNTDHSIWSLRSLSALVVHSVTVIQLAQLKNLLHGTELASIQGTS